MIAAEEYRKTIGKDAALERRFQPVQIDEPTVESTISILRGLKPRYEVHHGVEISDGALVTGKLSNPGLSEYELTAFQPLFIVRGISPTVISQIRL